MDTSAQTQEAERAKQEYAARLAELEAELQKQKIQAASQLSSETRRLQEEKERSEMLAFEAQRREKEQNQGMASELQRHREAAEKAVREAAAMRNHMESESRRLENEKQRLEEEREKEKERRKKEEEECNHHSSGGGGWELDGAAVHLERMVGEGTFGEVWLGRLHGQPVAVKKLKQGLIDGHQALEAMREELNVLARIRHPNIVLFMGAVLSSKQALLVTEYAVRGSLESVLHSSTPLTFSRKMHFARNVASGLAWLHGQKPPVLHRDVKPANCLVSESWDVVVSDFGLATVKKPDEQSKGFGSPFYMAPELLLNKPWGQPIDLYAYGITVWEILMRTTPFSHCESFSDLVDAAAIEGERPPVDSLDQPVQQLLGALWHTDPNARPQLTQLLDGQLFELFTLQHLVMDQAARDFWGRTFLRRTPFETVPWSEFLAAFYSHFSIAPLAAEDVGLQCLSALVTSQRGTQVTLEDFGRATRYFGPFGPTTLERARNVLSAGWFHGPVTPHETVLALQRARKAGCYLIRYASDEEASPNEAVLMLCIAGAAEPHPIQVTAEGYSFKGEPYDSLDSILMKHRRPLGLSIPCMGSRYDEIHFPEDDE